MENESGRKWDGGRGGEHSPGAGCRSGLASRRRRAAGRGKVGRHRCSLVPLATNAGHHRCPAPPTGIWVTTQSNCKKTQSLSLKLWYWTNKAEERTPSPRHRHRLQKNDWYHWSGETTLIARMPNWLWWITTGDLYLFHFIAFSH